MWVVNNFKVLALSIWNDADARGWAGGGECMRVKEFSLGMLSLRWLSDIQVEISSCQLSLQLEKNVWLKSSKASFKIKQMFSETEI